MGSVLIVDDEDALGDVLVEAFTASGFEALRASTGEEALEAFTARPYDLLLVDKNLPGMSGLDLIREVRARSAAAAIVMITGYSSPESAELALNLDVDAYLEKPFESIFGMVDLGKRILERRAASRAAPRDESEDLHALVAGPDAGTLAMLLGEGVMVETFPTVAALRVREETRVPDLVVVQSEGVDDLPGLVREVGADAPRAMWVVLYDSPLPLPLLQELIELGVKALFDDAAYRRTVGDLLEKVRERKRKR